MPPPWQRGGFGGGRPPWWPEGEAWPPAGADWQGMRRRFLRRLIIGFAIFFLLVFLAGALAWNIFGGDHGYDGGQDGYDGPPIFGLLLVFAGIFVVVRLLRRTAAPIGDVMEAAARVAEGDYRVRVAAHGSGEARRLAASFNEMTARLQTNDEQRRHLLADVAHELRTPLSIIRGNAEGMLDGVYPRDEEHLGPIVEETTVMARLLDDLQTLATAEAGALRLHREPVEVADLIDDVVAAFAPQAAARGVEIGVAVGPMPELEIDPVRIRQVLENLLVNALRYTPAGGTIRVAASSSGGAANFAVADSGPGIAPEALPHIFDRFSKSTDSGGSGLGLAIARSLVQAHGGEITAESQPGAGTTIRFTLPVG